MPEPHPTILLVEDEQQIRDLLRMTFEQAGYPLLIATDGPQALQIARTFAGRIDLLVSNVQMPGMTGPDLARELRRSRPGLRILLISGYSQGVLMLDQGWNFLNKPFRPSAILAKVKDVLSKPPATDTHEG
jgi:DNA-binding response OmpR family regulator